MTDRLTSAQDVVLSILRDGGFINQGNLVLVDRDGRCCSYDRRSLRVLINRDLVRVSQDTLRWEARLGNIEEEEDVMTDENYYKNQANAMCALLKDAVTRGEHGFALRPEMVRSARAMLDAYEKHEATSGKDTFQNLARLIGADPDWFGMTLEWTNIINGKKITSRYTVVGIDTTKPVNKIVLNTSRGKVRTTSVDNVARLLGDAKAPEERKRAIQV